MIGSAASLAGDAKSGYEGSATFPQSDLASRAPPLPTGWRLCFHSLCT